MYVFMIEGAMVFQSSPFTVNCFVLLFFDGFVQLVEVALLLMVVFIVDCFGVAMSLRFALRLAVGAGVIAVVYAFLIRLSIAGQHLWCCFATEGGPVRGYCGVSGFVFAFSAHRVF